MPPRILIAEDNDLQGGVLRSMLQGRGYDTELVTDGLQAVRAMRSGRFDLALLDYHLPQVDGLAAARLLDDMPLTLQRPRLIGMSIAVEEMRANAADDGARLFDTVVSKAHGLPALLQAVDAHLAIAMPLRAVARTVRWRLPRAALAGLGMAGVFALGLYAASVSFTRLDGAEQAVRQAQSSGMDAAALTAAVDDSALSQRALLATGGTAERAQFAADAQRVDRLLVSPGVLAGFGGDEAEPHAMVEARMRALADAAQDGPAAGPLPDPAAREFSARLRAWAGDVVDASHAAVLEGLEALRGSMRIDIGVLGCGVAYALWNAAVALRRRSALTPWLRERTIS